MLTSRFCGAFLSVAAWLRYWACMDIYLYVVGVSDGLTNVFDGFSEYRHMNPSLDACMAI